MDNGQIVRLRCWTGNEDHEDIFFSLPTEQYRVVCDLVRQGNKKEAQLVMMAHGERVEVPTLETDAF
ncbi:MAG: hypothetical protein HYY50_03185 [Candidatus Kerfeldbacteria bacterium]|nr:hypothetical protein [Candidatus Kerfeldbacteria bacterium]